MYIAIYVSMYHKVADRKFGKFGEMSAIRQTKTIQISSYN